MATISYAITVCNEVDYIENLLDHLYILFKAFQEEGKVQDEVVILQDITKQSDDLNQILEEFKASFLQKGFEFKLFKEEFRGDFAAWKNLLNSCCSKDYIFQIDADEIPCVPLCRLLPELLDLNKDVDLIRIPRENYVEGLTQEDIATWGWRLDEKERVNWPDYQDRVYRNDPKIKWEGKVHEKIKGCDKLANLPAHSKFALIHTKDIERQRRQNSFYQTLQR